MLKLALSKRKYETNSLQEVKAMTQVKSYIMGNLLPRVVNKSLPFLDANLTLIYFDLFDQAMLIETHLRDYHQIKIDHLKAI